MARQLAIVVLAGACVADSREIGAIEIGANCPADRPQLECYDGAFGECGERPTSELDESCCRRPLCDAHADCAEGLVCNFGGLYGLSCSEVEQDGELVCECGAPPLGGIGRPMCIPPQDVLPDWCTALRTQGECEAIGELTTLAEGDTRRCQWIEHATVRLEESACVLEPSIPACVTIRTYGGLGCAEPPTCTLDGDPTPFPRGLARPLDATSFELFAAGDVLCSTDEVIGWLPADDASLGPCALSCDP